MSAPDEELTFMHELHEYTKDLIEDRLQELVTLCQDPQTKIEGVDKDLLIVPLKRSLEALNPTCEK